MDQFCFCVCVCNKDTWSLCRPLKAPPSGGNDVCHLCCSASLLCFVQLQTCCFYIQSQRSSNKETQTQIQTEWCLSNIHLSKNFRSGWSSSLFFKAYMGGHNCHTNSTSSPSSLFTESFLYWIRRQGTQLSYTVCGNILYNHVFFTRVFLKWDARGNIWKKYTNI